jgi:hypothetical protein
MALLAPQDNVEIANKSFAEKRSVLGARSALLTQEIADQEVWGPLEIDDHQRRLASLAVKIWKI